MFIKLSRYARVYVSKEQLGFLAKYQSRFPILHSQIDIEDVNTVQILSAKGILVRKKLDDNTLYNLNKSIRFDRNAQKNRTRKANTGL
jgi:hypothetical protein